MASVFKRKLDRNVKGSRWWIVWTDETGKRRSKLGYTDKGATERLAAQLEDQARKRRDGLIDPAEERLGRHARTAIDAHLDDFAAHLRAKADGERHIGRVLSFIRAAATACKWEKVGDIDGPALSRHLDTLRAAGLASQSLNHRLRAVRSFTRWLWENHRLRTDPLLGVKPQRVVRCFERRALSDDEIGALLAVADQSDVVTVPKRYRVKPGAPVTVGVRRLRVPHRAMFYRVAIGTGFRVNELRNLTPADFDLDRDCPSIVVQAGYSKRKRRDVQPIRHDLVDLLRPWLATLPKGKRIWQAAPPNMAPVIQADLRAAGIDPLDGGVLDAHSLRHTFVSRLARANVSPKQAQRLARHSTITLTLDRYSHLTLADDRSALAQLPALDSAPHSAQRAG